MDFFTIVFALIGTFVAALLFRWVFGMSILIKVQQDTLRQLEKMTLILERMEKNNAERTRLP